ncbi:MAG: hypothetical protein ACKOE2_16450 [Actinomycetales bacterium]
MSNWRVQMVVVCLLLGALVGVALGAWLSGRVPVAQRVGRFNVAAAIFAGCVGLAGMIAAILVNV